MTIVIPVIPAKVTAQQKGAFARGKRVFFYTKAAVEREKRRIRGYLHAHRPSKPLEGPLRVNIVFVFPLTLALARKHATRLEDPTLLIPHDKRPDVDNSTKLVLDCATQAGLWLDDGQICDLRLSKFYGTDPSITLGVLPYLLASTLPVSAVEPKPAVCVMQDASFPERRAVLVTAIDR